MSTNLGRQDQQVRDTADNRIQINNLLSGLCIAILTVLLALPAANLGNWVIGQLAAAVPILVTSSLAYAKLKYREADEFRIWHPFGWVTHSIGYIMILNAIVIMLYRNKYPSMAWLLLAVIAILFVAYSALDVLARRRRLREKSRKLAFYFLLLFMGTILPMLLGCI